MASLPPESMLSHYRIKALIAKGGMGEVYKAVDVRLGRVVAIKVPAAIFAGNEKARHRFLREARSASILSHPNICTIHEVGREGELDFIVMEYVEGETIKDRLSQGPLPLEEALAFAVQIADALDDAHNHGVVHRDVKPTNITINRRGQAVVLDFGLAKQFEYAGLAEVDTQPGLQGVLTVDKSILGTIPYMSPEQVEGAPVDARSDIFSFGVMVYEMVAGRRPFDGRQDVDVMHAILHDEPAALALLRPEAGAELEGVIAKALNKDPAERYQTAGEMRLALLDVARRREFDQITKASLADQESPPTTELEKARHFPVRKVLTATVAGAVAGLLVYLFVGRGSERAPSVVKLLERNSAPGEQVIHAKFSPDGRSVVFPSKGGGDPDLWVTHPGGGQPTRITRDKWREWCPIWSPDGRQVAFASDREGQAGIYVVPAQGGTPQLLKGIEPPEPTLISWSRDKQAIYFEWRSNLHALDVETRQIIQKTNLSDTTRGPRSISLSADETRIAYVEDAGGVSEVRVLSLGGGEPTRVAAATAPTFCRLPFWHPDGRRIIYGSNPTGFYQLYVVDYLGDRVPKPLTSDNSEHRVTDVSRDGEKILYATSVEKAELWEVILAGGPQRRLDAGGAVNLWPEVSPDGQAVAYMSNTAIRGKLTDSAIVVKKLQGEEPPQAIASDGFDVSWSPDGSRLAFIRFKDGRYNITTVSVGDRAERTLPTFRVSFPGFSLLPSNRPQVRSYGWSPGGEWLAYCSEKSGAPNVWRVATDGSRDETVTGNTDPNRSFGGPLWSKDGGRLAFASSLKEPGGDGRSRYEVWAWARGTKETKLVFRSEPIAFLRLLGWSPSGEDLLVGTVGGGVTFDIEPTEVKLSRIALADGREWPVASVPSVYAYSLQPSSDRKHIAFAARRSGREGIWVMPAAGGEPVKAAEETQAQVYLTGLNWSPDGRAIYFSKQTLSSSISMIDGFR